MKPGSSRLGTIPFVANMGNRNFTANLVAGEFQNIIYQAPTVTPPTVCTVNIIDPSSGAITTLPCPEKYGRPLGLKRFELTNHLGNVISVISDRKLQNPGLNVDLINDYELPFSGQSALPAPLAGSTYCVKLNNSFSPNITTEVHVGDDVTVGVDYFKATTTSTGLLVLAITDEYGNYLYDGPTTGPLWITASVPATGSGSWQSLSFNKTILPVFSDAAKTIPYTGRIFINSHEWNPNVNDSWFDNHTVHITEAIPVVNNYKPEILETHDYYAFGMEMTGRNSGVDYNFSFNGKLDDTKDGWQTQDYGFRTYDYRLGRFLSQDPLKANYAYLTPYQFASNRPIDGDDLDGKEWSVKTRMVLGKNNKPKLLITLNVKAGFHGTDALPNNFIGMAELYVQNMYKAQYVTSTDMEVEIETTADFYNISASESAPIEFSYGDLSPITGVAGQTMDHNAGDKPNSQDAYITLFKRTKQLLDKTDGNSPVIIVATSVYDLLETIAHELGHTVGLAHDGNGNLSNEDQILTDYNNLMLWLGRNNTKAHLETFQIIRSLINILNDLKTITPNNKGNENKQSYPDILGKPTPSKGSENEKTT